MLAICFGKRKKCGTNNFFSVILLAMSMGFGLPSVISATPVINCVSGIDCPSQLPNEIEYKELFNEIRQYNFDHAYDLLYNYALIEAVNRLSDPKTGMVLSQALSDYLLSLINDQTKSDEQKKKEIYVAMENSMQPYKTQPVGALNLVMQHSIEFGVTKLIWDRKEKMEYCWDVYVSTEGSGGTETYVLKIPDYRIFRYVNGQEKEILKIKGRKLVWTNKLNISYDDWLSAALDVYNYITADIPFEINENQIVAYDYWSDFRDAGTTLEYKITSSNYDYQHHMGIGDAAYQCGESNSYESSATTDADGDGLVDFIPQEVYQNYQYYIQMPQDLQQIYQNYEQINPNHQEVYQPQIYQPIMMLENMTITPSNQMDFIHPETIIAGNNFLITGGANVTFFAGKTIELKPGFIVTQGSTFNALVR